MREDCSTVGEYDNRDMQADTRTARLDGQRTEHKEELISINNPIPNVQLWNYSENLLTILEDLIILKDY